MQRTRDMSKKQFDAACERHGFTTKGFMGYYDIGYSTEVSVLNAGDRRRDRLAYLLQQRDKARKRLEEAQKKVANRDG